MRGRLIKQGEDERYDFEEILFAISIALDNLSEVIIRNRQAVRRTQLVSGVLNPAIERLLTTQKHLSAARDDLHEYWQNRQENNWR